MYNNNTLNEDVKVLSPEARNNPALVASYNQLVEAVENDDYIVLSDGEFDEYFESVKNEFIRQNPDVLQLNEDSAEAAWWTLSPFDWIGGIKLSGLGKIFAPLKWLTGLILAGTGLLIAGIIKALHEGNKQLAIYKVRKWIESLSIIADGGYKKTRKSKDSLFLIEARARRDMLQAAVMLGEAAGLDIPEKTNEPLNPVESRKNESYYQEWFENYLFENEGKSTEPSNQAAKKQEFQTYRWGNQEYDSVDELKSALMKRGIGPRFAEGIEATTDGEQWVPIKDNSQIFQPEDLTDTTDGKFLEKDIDAIRWVMPRQNGGGENSKDYPYTDDGLRQFVEDLRQSSQSLKTLRLLVIIKDGRQLPFRGESGVYKLIMERIAKLEGFDKEKLDNNINQSYYAKPVLPDDSRVDWSLMTTLKTSKAWMLYLSFFRRKYKQNFWKEAKSVGKIKLDKVVDETTRQQYITQLIHNSNIIMNRIFTPGIARNYTNVINDYTQHMMGRSMDKARVNTLGGTQAQNYRFGNFPSATNESENVDDDFRQGGQIEWKITPEQYERLMNRNSDVQFNINTNRNLMDNTFQRVQQIFAVVNPAEYKIVLKTRDQMNRFLTELTKTVHTVIDNVAKKARDNSANVSGNSQNPVSGAILTFLSNSNADPKQNRSLHNLWDNMARNYLDSRAETRLDELCMTPEFLYLMDMINKVVPMCITSIFVPNNKNGQNFLALANSAGTKMSAKTANDMKGKRKKTDTPKEIVSDEAASNALSSIEQGIADASTASTPDSSSATT